MKRSGMTGMEAEGTLKSFPKWGSMVVPCWTDTVWSSARHVFTKIVLSRIGIMRVRIFTSSTCVTPHIFHLRVSSSFSPLITAALSRNLHHHHHHNVDLINLSYKN